MPDRARFVMIHHAELDTIKGDARALEVWCTLIRYADFDSQRAFPSLATLARTIDASEDTVRRAICRLENLGMVHVEERKNPGGDNSSNVYHLQRLGSTGGGSTDATPPAISTPTTGSTDATPRLQRCKGGVARMPPKQEPQNKNHRTITVAVDDLKRVSCTGSTDATPPGYNIAEAIRDALTIKRAGLPADSPSDRELILKCVCLKQHPLSEHWLWDALEGVTRTPTRKSIMGKFWTNCENGARDMGHNFRQLLKTVELPTELVAELHKNGKPNSQRQRQRA